MKPLARAFRVLLIITALLFLILLGFYLWIRQDKMYPSTRVAKKVFIQKKDQAFALIKNDQPFTIKGACGIQYISELAAAGGNTLRTYDTTQLGLILDEAAKNNISVVAGIYLPPSAYTTQFYDQPGWVAANHKAIEKLILKYRNHPALLMWCLGNELYFPLKPSYRSFYSAYNNLVDMIHRVDPNHPVTTTMINIDIKNLLTIKHRTQIDIISFNIFYGQLKKFATDIRNLEWIWKDPYLVSEWGIDGPWAERKKTAWSSPLEISDQQKSAELATIYQQYLPHQDSRLLGDFVFYWGHKQETTDTWFSFFSKAGAKTPQVAAMTQLWKGTPQNPKAPLVKTIVLMKDKIAANNILLPPDTVIEAAAPGQYPSDHDLQFEWAVYPEDWNKKETFSNNEQYMQPIPGLIQVKDGAKMQFKTPGKQGPYRLFVRVYDSLGNTTSANTPFYIIPKN